MLGIRMINLKKNIGKLCGTGVHRKIHAVDLKEGYHFGDQCIKGRILLTTFMPQGLLVLKLPELRRLSQFESPCVVDCFVNRWN
jgi:hypothetical protein